MVLSALLDGSNAAELLSTATLIEKRVDNQVDQAYRTWELEDCWEEAQPDTALKQKPDHERNNTHQLASLGKLANPCTDQLAAAQRTLQKPIKTVHSFATTATFAELVVYHYRKEASDRRSTVIFAKDVEGVNAVEAAFKKAGYGDRVEAISHKRPASKADRQPIFERFHNGTCSILVNCASLREGVDLATVSQSHRLGALLEG